MVLSKNLHIFALIKALWLRSVHVHVTQRNRTEFMKEMILQTRVKVCNVDELSAEERAVVDAARRATANSYAVYSHFNVGAAVRLDDGTVVCGTNQENAAYPSGLCAERTTLFWANS